jgi:PTH1 family peptidyl-tRNA hydrolase
MAWLVVGLGNPGPEYSETRHNAGFKVVDALGENLGASYWKDEAGARTALVRFGDDDLVLAEPQTYVNLSGKAIAKLAESYEVAPEKVVVIHDDLDLPPGVVRVKRGGGHGGHNGLRSINEQLGSGDYPRVRIGIGRPPGRMDPADYVLEPVRGAAADELAAAVPTAAQAVVWVLEHGVESAMQEYNGTA